MKYFFAIALAATLGFFSLRNLSHAQTVVSATSVTTDDAELKRKIGQMLIVGFRGTSVSVSSPIVKEANDLHLGGVILFDYDAPTGKYERNITGKTQVKSLISGLKKFSDPHLLVSIDLEGGAVNRLKPKYGFADFPSAQKLGKAGSLAATKKVGASIGTEISALGFNMDFAPSVDVNVNPKNPIIGAVGRSFSADPKVVAKEAQAFIAGLHSKGIISVIKHFPGHGSSTKDSHLGLVDVTATYRDSELLPFQDLAGSAEAVMVAHVVNTKIDPTYPATLSPLFIQNILRDKLHFSGVVISDDMSMGAIVKNYTLEDAVVRAINAGNDMLIVSNNGGLPYDEQLPYKVSTIIYDAVKSGKIPADTINAANTRIQKLKIDFKV